MSKFKYLALVTTLAATGSASAGLLGQQVTGGFEISSVPGTNFFDPANGSVPAGYLNSTDPPGTTVTIQEPAIEFGYEDNDNLYTANFTDNTLTIRNLVHTTATNVPFDMTFTSVTPGLFTSISLISDNFSPLLTYNLTGDTITIDWAGGDVTAEDDFVFEININTPANLVPEPTTLALMSVGLAGMIGLGKRRRVSAASA